MSPHAGIIITVSILLAAGLAVYENPQFQEWFNASRRKIAIALHSLGDEINPPSRPNSYRHDSSMSEDLSEAAEERRRRAREEIMRRGAILEQRRKQRPSTLGSFDTLVDKDGNLKKTDDEVDDHATTSGVDIVNVDENGLTRRLDTSRHTSMPPVQQTQNDEEMDPDLQEAYRRSLHDEMDPDLREAMRRSLLDVMHSPSSNHPSESLIDITPTSEFPDPDISIPGQHHQNIAQSEYFSLPPSSIASSHTEDGEPDFYYAHPSNPTNATHMSPYPISPPFQDVSSAPSIAGSLDHVHAADFQSEDEHDAVMSEVGDGIATPAGSWSEVGSVVSSEGHA